MKTTLLTRFLKFGSFLIALATLLNAPNENLSEIISLLPGMKSPTVLPLAEPGWSSVHSVVNEDDFWDIIEKLKLAGAQGILVVPIEKMIL